MTKAEATGNHQHYTKKRAEFYSYFTVHYFIAFPSTIITTEAIQSQLLYFTAVSEALGWLLLSVTVRQISKAVYTS